MSERHFVFLGVLCFVVFALIETYATIINFLANKGQDLVTVQVQLKQYQDENAILEEQLLTREAYTTISQEARNQGYTQEKTILLP